MAQIVLSGFSDEIAPELDIQLAAIREWGLPHRAAGGRRGKRLGLFPRESERSESQAGGGGGFVSSIGSPLGKISIEEDFPPTWRRSSAPWKSRRSWARPPHPHVQLLPARGPDPARFRGEVLERLHRMVEEAAAWDSVLLHENEKGIYGDNASRCQDLLEQLAGPPFPGGV